MFDISSKKFRMRTAAGRVQSAIEVETLTVMPHYRTARFQTNGVSDGTGRRGIGCGKQCESPSSISYSESCPSASSAQSNASTAKNFNDDEEHAKITKDLEHLERMIHARKKTSQINEDKSSQDTPNRENLMELEKLNFQMWLLKKKRQELEDKHKQRTVKEQEELQMLEKEKRHLENKLTYTLWLKRKEEETLKRKINVHKEKIKALAEKNNRLEKSRSAYKDWLESSKTRQKPLPINQGLNSLCAKSSISFINPQPWQFD